MPTPRILSCEQVRAVDRRAIDVMGVPSIVLMENAGRGVAEALLDFDPGLFDCVNGRTYGASPVVAIVCGKGNNGGDGFVVARHLEIRGLATLAVLLSPPDQIEGDAATNLRILRHCHTSIVDLSAVAPSRLGERLDQTAGGSRWIVDAILGTGAQGPPREPFATAIAWANLQPAKRLAIDLPSGLDADRGEPSTPTFCADVTVTLVALKPGLIATEASPYVGQVRVASIGTPLG